MINFIKKLFKKEKKLKKETQPIVVKQEFDYDKLAMAIVKAQKMIEADENRRLEEQQQQELTDWYKAIGYDEYDEDHPPKLRQKIKNFFSVMYHFLFFKRNAVVSDTVTFALLKMATSGIFSFCEIISGLTAFALFLLTFVTVRDNAFIFHFEPLYLAFSLASFIFARIFRIASFEMENLKDKNYLIAIFSATTCFFAMVFALIALFKG